MFSNALLLFYSILDLKVSKGEPTDLDLKD
jgi:hypothetical protein